jgi:hypothetical protein
MPPKESVKADAEAPVFVFEKDRALQKFNVELYKIRANVQPIDVPRRPPVDPAKKLKERLDTYHNVRKMRTDYKNYVRRYGEPSFDAPVEIKT